MDSCANCNQPLAAATRVLDGSGVLTKTGEHYKRFLVITIMRTATSKMTDKLCKPCFFNEIKNNLYPENLE